MAESLARVLPGNAEIRLVDYDRVEPRNLRRQNFYPEDIGDVKSRAIANRLTRRYDRAIQYSTLPVAELGFPGIGLVVSCVDNGPARGDIALKLRDTGSFWWIDAGNGENYGQVIIGNGTYARFDKDTGVCTNLPYPTIQRPELLLQGPAPEPDCAEIDIQGPTINQSMAALTVEMVRHLIQGKLEEMQIIMDMEHFSIRTVAADPEECKRILHTKSKEKIQIYSKPPQKEKVKVTV